MIDEKQIARKINEAQFLSDGELDNLAQQQNPTDFNS